MKKFELFESKDYGSFKELEYNRDVDPVKVNRIADSLKKFGLTQPIVVSKDGFVIDGQHRLAALTRLQLPVHYVVINKYTVQQIAEINNTQYPWKLIDYVRSQAMLGNVDCQHLIKLFDKHPHISKSVLVKIYSLNHHNHSTTIRNGKWKLNVGKGDALIHMYKMLEDYLDADEKNKIYQSRFAEAIYKVIVNNPTFSMERFIMNLSSKPLRFYNSREDNVSRILEIYNAGLSRNKLTV
jgi:hypothetical protein